MMPSQFEINRTALTDYLDSRGLRYLKVVERRNLAIYAYKADVSGTIGSINMFLDVGCDYIRCIGSARVNVGEDMRPAVTEYLTRVNYGLDIGTFEMGYADGNVDCRCILFCANGHPSREDVGRVVNIPSELFSVYGDGLLKVGTGTLDPASAFAETEG